MRLWHQKMISKLPRQQLLGQHREICALRGNGWEKPHAIVNYVFRHSMAKLVAYHFLIINEMRRRGYGSAPSWLNVNYRGQECAPNNDVTVEEVANLIVAPGNIYTEHDDRYLKICLDNLKMKGITLALD